MNKKIFARSIFLLFLFLSLGINSTSAGVQTRKDSIKKNFSSLKGEARLQALMDIYTLISMGDDFHGELAALEDLRTEAARQGNADFEGQARVKQVFCFYNYNKLDSLEKVLPNHLKFMAQHEQWDYYYNSWEAKIESLLYADRTQTALKE